MKQQLKVDFNVFVEGDYSVGIDEQSHDISLIINDTKIMEIEFYSDLIDNFMELLNDNFENGTRTTVTVLSETGGLK